MIKIESKNNFIELIAFHFDIAFVVHLKQIMNFHFSRSFKETGIEPEATTQKISIYLKLEITISKAIVEIIVRNKTFIFSLVVCIKYDLFAERKNKTSRCFCLVLYDCSF